MERRRSRGGTTLALLACVAALPLLARCGSARGKVLETPTSLIGTWGGNGIRMTIGEQQTAVTYNCGDGVIDAPIIPFDGTGRFEAEGTYDVQGGGPMPSTPRAASYRGSVAGMSMSLTVILVDTGQSAGSFSLALGSDGVLGGPCPD